MRPSISSLLPLSVVALCAPLCANSADVAACEMRFPLEVRAVHGPDQGVELTLRAGDLATLRELDAVALTGATLSDATEVDLDLVRVPFDESQLDVRLDGQLHAHRLDDTTLSLWSGHVRGDVDSDVYMAFSRYGTRGWIRTRGEYHHVLAGPGPARDWSQSVSRIVSEQSLNARGYALGEFCQIDRLAPRPGAHAGAANAHSASQRPSGGQIAITNATLECRMAFETDYQLFQAFGDVIAEETYIASLFGAGSGRYNAEVDTALTMVSLQLYSNPSDPWNDADDSVARLVALQSAFMGNIPNGANLMHLLSGDGLGGGVAWLDVLCDTTYGFGVSGNITLQGGQVPFPVVQGPLTWDFVVFTHETGHNFGTPHTHDFCPPLDTCAPAGYFGTCQTSQTCISNGTLMSYCHLCSGGMNNVAPNFHPACADLMHQRALASCMGAFEPGVAYCFGDGSTPTGCPCAPPNSVPSPSGAPDAGCANSFNLNGAKLSAKGDINPDTVVLTGTGASPVGFGFFVKGSVNAPGGIVNGDGVQCVNGSLVRFGSQNAVGGTFLYPNPGLGFTLPVSDVGATPDGSGLKAYYQIFYRNNAPNFCSAATTNMSNAYRIQWN